MAKYSQCRHATDKCAFTKTKKMLFSHIYSLIVPKYNFVVGCGAPAIPILTPQSSTEMCVFKDNIIFFISDSSHHLEIAITCAYFSQFTSNLEKHHKAHLQSNFCIHIGMKNKEVCAICLNNAKAIFVMATG